jgi:hypothetical protein
MHHAPPHGDLSAAAVNMQCNVCPLNSVHAHAARLSPALNPKFDSKVVCVTCIPAAVQAYKRPEKVGLPPPADVAAPRPAACLRPAWDDLPLKHSP